MSDTETRFRIELHGETSGLLDTISGDSMAGVRDLLIRKLETGLWTFNDGDTMKVIAGNKGYVYVIATESTVHSADDYMHVYCESNGGAYGILTTIRKRDGVWRQSLDGKKPKRWKTENGADAALMKLQRYDPKRKLAIVKIRWED